MNLSLSQPQWLNTDETPAVMISVLDHLGLMRVTGEQGRSFIHGQVTTDISSLEKQQWRWGAHCDPKGKMLAAFRTFALDDALMLMMPKDTLQADLPQLAKYAVFSKAELTDASDDYRIIGVAGNDAATWIHDHFGELTHEVNDIPGGLLLKDADRFIIIIEQSAATPLLGSINEPLYRAEAWQALEISAGYPNIRASHQGQFVPQMCNLQAINGISFEKGCYMGQETVARMKYRGGNKRALYIVAGTSADAINTESQLEIAIEDGFKKIGTIIEVAQYQQQVLLTAVLPNDTEIGSQLRIAGCSDSSLTVQPLPYSLEEE
ncbi:tRNA-modifying protein YgfZ [Shewanella waksmanii]|uniref:tRNA-modifying protein YgfZ n=1 Tax=Shewanella waksmanii TaxID=213783 RepID=UPI00373597F9